MNRNSSIQFKVALLLTVFILNTVLGFACSVGLNMGFNRSHHHEEIIPEHSDKNIPHHHEAGDSDHKSKKEKDNCCKDEVTKLQKVDKIIPQSLHFNFNPPIFTIHPLATYCMDALTSSPIHKNNYFVRLYHPPIPDVRIAIQSFQI